MCISSRRFIRVLVALQRVTLKDRDLSYLTPLVLHIRRGPNNWELSFNLPICTMLTSSLYNLHISSPTCTHVHDRDMQCALHKSSVNFFIPPLTLFFQREVLCNSLLIRDHRQPWFLKWIIILMLFLKLLSFQSPTVLETRMNLKVKPCGIIDDSGHKSFSFQLASSSREFPQINNRTFMHESVWISYNIRSAPSAMKKYNLRFRVLRIFSPT